MTETGKVLAQGQLTASTTTLYTVPALTTTYVKNIVFCNDDTVQRTFTLFVGGSAAANQVAKAEPIDASRRVLVAELMTLEAAQTIQGKADSATKVTYTIFGIEVA